MSSYSRSSSAARSAAIRSATGTPSARRRSSSRGDALKGTVALTDELYGSGHVVLFAYNPLFRAYEESGEHLFANAVLYPAPVAVARAAPTMTDLATAEGVAEAAAAAPQEPDALVSTWRPFRIEVATADIDTALSIAVRFGESPRVEEAGDSAFLVLANPEGVDAHEHPFVRQLLAELLASDVEVRSASL